MAEIEASCEGKVCPAPVSARIRSLLSHYREGDRGALQSCCFVACCCTVWRSCSRTGGLRISLWLQVARLGLPCMVFFSA